MGAVLDLTAKQALHLRVHNFVARFGVDRLKRLSITPDRDGFVLHLDQRDVVVPSALLWRSYRRGWEARQDRLKREFGLAHQFPVSKGDTVIDIGANMGDFSIAAAMAGARVFSFDGDPDVVACLNRNTAEIDAITTDCAILWKEETELTFYSAPGRADSSVFLAPKGATKAFCAQATTLDALAEKHGIGAVKLLKMDAEGAEPEVLIGGKATLARTAAVAIDTGPERLGEETREDCVRILTEYGFEILPGYGERRKITMAKRG
ncbi:FkbM family methyltransferase [Rhodovulum sp. FJ3]|uniref:FkbM family methyltransferase n=1 Tax=Rhodovulum sp. FJ3 TaxID=3079053 RepID=UPI00293DBB5C|nr:FkbM family methyltransferase [Rhodovulum sp. FJ3]MDV4168265.1 FkbM family methyltransferase [Rhodovulum sp. FJ3]